MQAQSETNNPAVSASTQAIRTEIRDQVLIVTIDTPGERVNTLGESMIGEFEGLMDLLERDPALMGALIVSGKRNSFIAGADIGLFQTRTTAAELEELSLAGHRMMDRIAGAGKPIVIGIHGACMGGGTELALACHYRIVTQHPSTAIGLPEVQLGILPGMGGTQRLPRLIGVQKALTYMLTGRKMYARQARRNGFADEVVHAYGLQDAGIRRFTRWPVVQVLATTGVVTSATTRVVTSAMTSTTTNAKTAVRFRKSCSKVRRPGEPSCFARRFAKRSPPRREIIRHPQKSSKVCSMGCGMASRKAFATKPDCLESWPKHPNPERLFSFFSG